MQILANNKKAYFDYFIEDEYEAGIELKGTEVKSIKLTKVSIKESFVRIIKNEMFIMGMFVSNYSFGNINNVNETRVRKLLLHKKEISKIHEKTKIKGYTIVPLSVYNKGGIIKVKIALARGKKNYDKRALIANVNIDTIIAAPITPKDIAKKLFLKSISNIEAASMPVYAPVPGIGTATNNNKAINIPFLLFFINSSPTLCPFLNT